MTAYVIFDVDIFDQGRYRDFTTQVEPAVLAAGGTYLARGGIHTVYEGDWTPRRIVILQFPTVGHWESFYNGPTYRSLKRIRDECSTARLVAVQGLSPDEGDADCQKSGNRSPA